MGQRIYSVPFSNTSISAVQDLFSLQPGASTGIEIHEIRLGQITATSVGNLRLTFKRFSSTFSIGSGGSSVTPAKHNFNDAAALSTARANDTTQTSAGTSVTIQADVYNVVNGYQYLPAPEDRIQIPPNQCFVCSLDTAPGSAETMNGVIVFAEVM